MTDKKTKDTETIPEAIPKALTTSKDFSISPVWVIPIIAALIAAG